MNTEALRLLEKLPSNATLDAVDDDAMSGRGPCPLDNFTLNDVRELRAHLAAQEDGWRPIETAPRDGRTLLLGRFSENGKWRTMRGQWMSDDYIAEYWEDPEGVNAGWYEDAVEAEDIPNCWPIEPTHWQPLPSPPGELAKQTEAK